MSDRLREYLQRNGVQASLVRPGAEMPTVALAAAALGVAEDDIVKSIVLEEKRAGGKVAIAVLLGTSRVDRPKVAAALSLGSLRMASAEVALSATGYPVGGIPPLGYTSELPVAVDLRVMQRPEVFGGGGDEEHMLRVAPGELVRINRATVADIAARNTEP